MSGDLLQINRNITLSLEERQLLRSLQRGSGSDVLTVDGLGDRSKFNEAGRTLVEKHLAEEPVPGGFRLTRYGRRIAGMVKV